MKFMNQIKKYGKRISDHAKQYGPIYGCAFAGALVFAPNPFDVDMTGVMSGAMDMFNGLFPAMTPVIGIQLGIALVILIMGLIIGVVMSLAKRRN